jgi:hypothetical protein
MEIERGSTRSHYVENCFGKGYGPVVGIAKRCGLMGPGIESRWGRDFPAPVQSGPVAHPASYTMDTGSFPGRGVDHSPTSSAEVKESVSKAIPLLHFWVFVAYSRVKFALLMDLS